MKDRIRRAMLAIYIFIGCSYAFLLLLNIHVLIVMQDTRNTSVVNAVGPALSAMARGPFAIFPLPRGTPSMFFWTTAACLTVFMLTYYTDVQRRGYKQQDKVQGDAQWLEELDKYNRKFTEPFGTTDHDGPNNMILSQDIFMSMNNQKIRRNMNVFVIGGSGAGKSFNFVGPNLMQANCSYVVTDPSGGLYKEYGNFLEGLGYHVKCFNLDHMEKGNHYNPFHYISKDNADKDIEILVTTLISNTTPKDKQGGDPFWEKSETALLVALIAYLFHHCEESMQTFGTVMKLMRMADINEEDSSQKSDLDRLFERAEKDDPESFAVKQYKTFKMGAGKTLKGILISCAVRLQGFDLEAVDNLTCRDDIELDDVGDEKTALFVIIPTGEKTFNYLASMMYSQLFQRLYGYCENTAEFSTLVIDSDFQLVKTFRADGPSDHKEKEQKAREFFERAKNAKIVLNEEFDWWELRTSKNELVTWRKTEADICTALAKIRKGQVIPNSQQSNHGQRLPIHTRLILDEFANIGKIPEFPEKVATIRKYELSVSIILQSLTQMKKMYKDEWGEISGNCDNTIYLGGGADPDTTEWISKLLGKETRTIINTTFSKGGGSMALNKQGVELFAPAQLRTMPEDECIIIPKSEFAYKGLKYNSLKHPNRKKVEECPPYYFNPQKAENLKNILKEIGTETGTEARHGETVPPEDAEKRDQVNKNKEQAAKEYAQNADANGEEQVCPPEPLRKGGNCRGPFGLDGKRTQDEVKEELMEDTDKDWGLNNLDFGTGSPQNLRERKEDVE